ncbi:hypothetical protein CPB86DRAFT_117882 [Serendipita vermifera]|nr:hypothetical protein CPB86DRAFT_117882 [Serendipita vermifera]
MDKAPGSRILNERVPFEILWAIFEKYAETDSPKAPLEKLLSVCRAWRIAACQHKTLWASFRIVANSNQRLRFWYSRIPTRIFRCGEETLLNIEMDSSSHTEGQVDLDDDLLSTIASLFIGKDGVLIRRWKSLSLKYLPVSLHDIWNHALSCPTPNLRILQITALWCKDPILPFSSSLEELQLSHYSFRISSSLENLRVVTLEDMSLRIDNLWAVLSSTNLTTLNLRNCNRTIQLPFRLPALQELCIEESHEVPVVTGFEAPRLRSLSLSIQTKGGINSVRRCQGIDFEQLDTFTLAFKRGIWHSLSTAKEILDETRQLIHSSPNIKLFRALSKIADRAILRCIEDDVDLSATLRRSRVLEVMYPTHGRIDSIVAGTFSLQEGSSVRELQRIREYINTPRRDTWNLIALDFSTFSGITG